MWLLSRKGTPWPAASEATAARQKAERDLARTRAETPEYQALGAAMRELRTRNNFGAAIASAFRGGRRR